MRNSVKWFLIMNFPSLLVHIRKKRGLTQQALADSIDLHVNQIKRYEAGTAQPTLDTLVRLAHSLHVTLDELVFDETERSPSEEFKLQFEALNQFDAEDRKVAKALLEGLILKHNAKQSILRQE